jgi:hypothetical protein
MALFSHILDYNSFTGFDLGGLSRKTRARGDLGAPQALDATQSFL